ncbi:ATP-binding protein [Agitococcus lubricus]|uniref:histidine kinase n=1 Tax=Agitococcus lubricus TaxID=1077255 RepID=A0A2T5IZC7_9GAMM|nr:ATP-binding protein [Agitococcus lubricus]PTQ89311.1 two-component system sensor histidine kinase KdpD [Agitococcus lubricus]
MLKKYNHLITLLIMLSALLLSVAVQPFIDPSSLVMVYMIAVVITAFFVSLGAAIFISLCSVFVFDYLNLPPYMEFTRKPAEYVFTLVGMLVTAATISTLATRLRQKLHESKQRELRSSSLYQLAASLADSLDNHQVVQVTLEHITTIFQAKAELLSSAQALQTQAQYGILTEKNAAKVFRSQQGEESHVLIPIYVDHQFYGLLTFASQSQHIASKEQVEHLQTIVYQMILTIERNNLQEKIHISSLKIEQETLRNTILNAISHDLRTPLATIIGASSSLLQQGMSAEARMCLSQAIYEESLHMQNMVENLLEMARLQSGEYLIKKEWQALEELVANALVTVKRRLKTQHLRVSVPDDLPLIQCDRTLIERVLVNLLDNASKYSPDYSEISIHAFLQSQRLMVTVSDQGCGMSDDELKKICQPFYRVNYQKTGFGLGLSICKTIAQAHQGSLEIQSKPQQGTTVILSLPISHHTPVIETDDESILYR